MCGIAGALDLRGRRTFDPAALVRMAAAVRHRGPDDSRAWSEPGVALASERLAIVDAANGRQPLSDPTGGVWVSANAELFGAPELRAELEARGHVFRTRCDTELWPAMYLEWGEGLFERARGQFAVALWDRTTRTLLLGRDRFGICPLHWAVADGWLLWSSEVKGILASGLVAPEADLRGIDHVFSLFASGTRRTCFRGVESIPPGHYLSVRGGERRIVRHWDLDFPRRGEERRDDPARLASEMEDCLRAAVERRLASDGPVATYLSGGLDSALVLGLAGPRQAFTIGYEGGVHDERSGAVRAASALGSPLEPLVLTDADVAAAIPGAVFAAEAPIMDTADACLSLLAERVAARGFKVALSGEGADEAMGGYVWNKTAAALDRVGRAIPAAPRAIRRVLQEIVAPGGAPPPFAETFGEARPALFDLFEPLSRARSLFYAEATMDALRGYDPFSDLDVDPARMRAWHPLNRSLYVEYKVMLAGHLLQGKSDRVGMRSGVEGRYPFLDEAFVDLARSLAPEYKLRGTREKWLLREVARRVLPAPIADPPKRMFKAPPLAALRPRPAWAAELTSPESLRKTGYFSPEKVAREERLQRLLPAFAPRRAVADGTYTCVMTTQLWHHLFLGGGLCDLAGALPSGRG